MKKTHLLTGLLAAILFNAVGQKVDLPFTLEVWDTVNVKNLTTEIFSGKESIFLKTGEVIVTKNVDFADGTIEVDMNFPDARNFPGVVFHMQDFNNSEVFYIGPSKSGKPDALRYTPFFNGQQAWQLYYGEGFSKAFSFKFNAWHHFKIDVHGLQADIYINDMQTPVFVVPELKHGWKGGKIALFGDEGALHFANASYTPRRLSPPTPVAIPANGTNGMITQWQVSNVVDQSLFEKKYQLTPGIKEKLTWTPQSSDASGLLNLSRFATLSQTANTMVAKVVIESASEQLKAVSFAFSDKVNVYLNDKAVYQGSDVYGSRDFQFLGTVGLFDTLFLPLKKGNNELWFVVTDYFGGWGVKATLENMENVVVK